MANFEVVFICNSNNQEFVKQIESKVYKCKPNFKYCFYSSEDIGPFYYSSFEPFLRGKETACVILLDSDAVVNHEFWAKILISPILAGEAKVCGSMASWESRLSSAELVHKIQISKLFRKISQSEEDILQAIGAKTLKISIHKKIALRMAFNSLLHKKLKNLLIKQVSNKTFSSNAMRLKKFPKFPNPSLRMCGIAVETQHLLNTLNKFSGAHTKLDALLFESGIDSISNIGNSELVPLVYVSQGFVPITDLRAEESFRTDSHFIPLVTDEHYDDYLSKDLNVRQILHNFSWSLTKNF